jgi:hypothetical protein
MVANWQKFGCSAMPFRSAIDPPPPETPTELRNRALSIRRHAADFGNDLVVPQWLALAAELETQAAALEMALGGDIERTKR